MVIAARLKVLLAQKYTANGGLGILEIGPRDQATRFEV